MNTEKDKITSLTGLKVIALLLIFYWHCILENMTINLGGRCCEFFFVVSGFLVAYNFNKKNFQFNVDNSLDYFKKKLFAFYPIHLITFIICLIWLTKFNPITATFHLLLIHSWVLDSAIFFDYNWVSWFISSILFCYFLAPYLMTFIQQKKILKSILLLVLVLSIRILVELLPSKIGYNLWQIDYHVNPLIRCMEFFSGMLLLPLYLRINQFKNNKIFTKVLLSIFELSSLILIYYLWCYTDFSRGIYIPFIALLILIFSLNGGIMSFLLSTKANIVISSVEYIFFMFHQPIIKILESYFEIYTATYTEKINVLLIVIIFSHIFNLLINILKKVKIKISNRYQH